VSADAANDDAMLVDGSTGGPACTKSGDRIDKRSPIIGRAALDGGVALARQPAAPRTKVDRCF